MSKQKAFFGHTCHWCKGIIKADEDYYLMDTKIKTAFCLPLDDSSRKPMCKSCYNIRSREKRRNRVIVETIEMFP